MQHSDPTRPYPSPPQERLWCGRSGSYWRAPGSLRPWAILIRQPLVRALIVLALTLCPVYHWTSQWRAPSLEEGVGETEKGLVGGGGSSLYRAPIKGSLSERLCGPKKGMFILQPGDGLSQGKEWTARGEGCFAYEAWHELLTEARDSSEQERWRRKGKAEKFRWPVNTQRATKKSNKKATTDDERLSGGSVLLQSKTISAVWRLTIKWGGRESIMGITLHRVGDKLWLWAGETLCLETVTTYKTKKHG